MTVATLASIRAALKTQLGTLLTTASPAGPLKSVVSFRGRAAQARLPQLAALGNLPAVVFAFDGERYGTAGVRTLLGAREYYGTSTWVVWVISEGSAENEDLANDSSSTGSDALTDDAIDALAGLEIDGLKPGAVLEIVSTMPIALEAGVIGDEIRLTATRQIAGNEPSIESDPLTIHGDINLEGQPDDEPNPVAEIEVVV
jgi:hypothetical protein